MARSYSFYYKPATVTVMFADKEGTLTTSTGTIYYGIRASEVYLGDTKIRQITGLLSLKELTSKTSKVSRPVTTYRVTHSDVAARMFLIYELAFTLVPVAGYQPVDPYGAAYATSLVFDTAIPVQNAADSLYSSVFKLGSSQTNYKVLDGSIKEKRSKRNSPNIPSGAFLMGGDQPEAEKEEETDQPKHPQEPQNQKGDEHVSSTSFLRSLKGSDPSKEARKKGKFPRPFGAE